jgi:hypothetical protein
MDQIHQLLRSIRQHLLLVVLAENAALLSIWVILEDFAKLSSILTLLIGFWLVIGGSILIAAFSGRSCISVHPCRV